MDRRTNGRTDTQISPVFYRTSSLLRQNSPAFHSLDFSVFPTDGTDPWSDKQAKTHLYRCRIASEKNWYLLIIHQSATYCTSIFRTTRILSYLRGHGICFAHEVCKGFCYFKGPSKSLFLISTIATCARD